MGTDTIKNIAAYKFVDTPERFIQEIRLPLRDYLRRIGARGTVILSTEGINLFLSGTESVIDAAWNCITGYAPYADLALKESYSESIAFNRMLVKIKEYIIPVDVEDVRPVERTGPRIDPRTLKEWLDEGKDVTLLDTRNIYEVKLGTFHNALDLQLDTFRHFGDAVDQLDDSLKEKPVVMFCTGGIRCEKASPIMMDLGFKEVYQLEGGILKYFEEVGSDHYDGECFVFDHRVALNPALEETDTAQCFMCQEPLTKEQQQSDRYEVGKYCPYCYDKVVQADD
ncbi:MAG: sulfurtransferase [Rhodothermales bacterium]|nr:sulfurtransferase [Rhodothermales bacterium]